MQSKDDRCEHISWDIHSQGRHRLTCKQLGLHPNTVKNSQSATYQDYQSVRTATVEAQGSTEEQSAGVAVGVGDEDGPAIEGALSDTLDMTEMEGIEGRDDAVAEGAEVDKIELGAPNDEDGTEIVGIADVTEAEDAEGVEEAEPDGVLGGLGELPSFFIILLIAAA